MRKRLLVHICCGPCATHTVEVLQASYDVALFFYNPNIWPEDEYRRRLKAARTLAKDFPAELIEGEYDPLRFEELTAGHEHDQENGERCRICFQLRLDTTAKRAKDYGFDAFTTTLPISVFKDKLLIRLSGKDSERRIGIPFLEVDLGGQEGFNRSRLLSRQHNLYRQKYCGCRYSLESSIASPKL
jgi:hypothetical protein